MSSKLFRFADIIFFGVLTEFSLNKFIFFYGDEAGRGRGGRIISKVKLLLDLFYSTGLNKKPGELTIIIIFWVPGTNQLISGLNISFFSFHTVRSMLNLKEDKVEISYPSVICIPLYIYPPVYISFCNMYPPVYISPCIPDMVSMS